MPHVDPAMAQILAMLRAQDLRPYNEMTTAEAKVEYEVRNAFWNRDPPELAEVEDVTIEGTRGALHIRLFVPHGADDPSPAIVYLHGGGWVLGSRDSHDGVCRRLARAGVVRVASVEYGLAPEDGYPHGLVDAVTTIRWLAEHGLTEGIDPARLALAGDSAGANLALAACLKLRDHDELGLVRAAALIYGIYSPDLDSPSHAAFGAGDHILSTATMAWFWRRYVPDPKRRSDPLVSPRFADLRGLPPLYVSAAELDPLRDDSERLARRLIEAGVDLDWRLWPGVAHSCIQMARLMPQVQGWIEDIAAFLVRRMNALPDSRRHTTGTMDSLGSSS